MAEWRDNEAAIVAARLAAFSVAPAEFRARLARGEEAMPQGGVLLRFAQGRVPDGWDAAASRRVRAAAEDFIRAICLREGADHYQVLCASRDATPEAIKQNYHLLMGLLHPDRQDATTASWPQGCAQRVNVAYAALGDDAARKAYDATLPGRPAPGDIGSPPRRNVARPAADARFARTLLVASIVVAAIVVALMSVHEDDWSDRTLMDAAIVALRSKPPRALEQPRFVGARLEPARATDATQGDESSFAFIEPLLRRIRGEEPRAFAPAPAIVAPAQAKPAASPQPADRGLVASAGAAEKVPPLRITQNLTAPAPAAPTPAKAAATRPNNEDIERLVVALVGYYEAGDADHLVNLVDTQSAGYWRAAQLRQSYADFFAATRSRRLRVERLAWDTQPGSAAARGEATVTAEYFDRNATLERRVPVELHVGMRDGKVLITRLSLFPVSR